MPVIDLGSVVGPQGPQGATGATGAQGLQGNPGPNQVTNQTSTNLAGVLFGSQSKVTVKPVDTTGATEGGTNLISSGAVYTALVPKANQTQLAPVESSNTASQAYNVGDYFCMGGLLYMVTTAISSGGTITPGTNCEAAVVGNWMPKTVLVSGGESITITPNASTTSFTLLIAVQGNRAVTSGLYYVSGFSLTSTYHIITPIVNATQISVTSSGGVITVKNNHTDNLYMNVVILQTNGRMIIAKS